MAASSMTVARKEGAMLAHKSNAVMCKQPNSKAKRLSKAEKRRVAAMKGWEKRRNEEKMVDLVKKAASNRKRPVSNTNAEVSTSSSEEDIDDGEAEPEEDVIVKKPISRSEAARLGWARRKKMLVAKAADESTSSSEVEEDEDEEAEPEEDVIVKRPLSKSEAARLGWARRKKMLAAKAADESTSSSEVEEDEDEEAEPEEDVIVKRPLSKSEAARLGWARRKKMLAAKAADESTSSSEVGEDEDEEAEPEEDVIVKRPLSKSEAARLGWARRKKMLAAKAADESTSSSEVEEDEDEEAEPEEEDTSKRPLSKSEAARLGWARRKKMLAAKAADESTSSSEVEEDEDEEAEPEEEDTSKRPLSKSEAARLGWARRKKMLAAKVVKEEKTGALCRSEAAKMGWRLRKEMLAEAKTGGRLVVAKSKKATTRTKSYSFAARARAAKEGWRRRKLNLSGADPTSIPQEEEPPTSKKVYTSEDRSKAAKVAWENRRAMLASRRGSSFSDRSPTRDKLTSTIKDTRKGPTWLKSEPREGAKRSRRLAQDSVYSNEESIKKMNELVSFLKVRGWMEFHPSSRHGSGTATYGYIPGSIAAFIRGGTVSKSVVLEHGTLGVHYALDFEGYGGLKEMTDNFGVDYSPYPTEEMVEVSRARDMFGNRNLQVSAWDLGEDLPWQEVEQAEKKRINEYRNKMILKNGKDETPCAVADDLLFVANILASLNHGATCNYDEQDERDQHIDILSEFSSSDSQSPGVSQSTDTDATFIEDDSVKGKHVDNDVLSIQSKRDFSQWSFGIC